MATIRGCFFPDELLYDVPNHVWYQPLDDGTVRAGMTTVAIALAREVLLFTPKRVGREVEKNQSFATIESAKWIGAVRAGFDGTVVAINETLVARPTLANTDPYGAAWMLTVRPTDANWRAGLVTGVAVQSNYEAWMDREAFAGCAGHEPG